MADVEFVEDLQDVGLLSKELPAQAYNDTLIGTENLALRETLAHHLCSVNQSRLARWTWLIGKEGGTLHPMLCATRRRLNCTSGEHLISGESHSMHLLIAIECFLGLFLLVNLAVWCRIKMPTRSSSTNHRESEIPLLLLRMQCIIDLIGTVSPLCGQWLHARSFVRVFSVFHALLFAQLFNAYLVTVSLYRMLTGVISLLTAIYLIEHPVPRVLMLNGVRRAGIIVCIASIICFCFSLPESLFFGFAYCENGSSAYLLTGYFLRISFKLLRDYNCTLLMIASILGVPTVVLVVIYVSKHRCACWRSSTSTFQGFETVTYVRQLDEMDNTDDCSQEVAIGDVEPLALSDLALVTALRRLLFWQLVFRICDAPFYLMEVAYHFSDRYWLLTLLYEYHLRWIWALLMLLSQCRLVILSPIIATYRSSYRNLFIELKDFATESIRVWSR